jgi:type II secretory pathway pseudopilin PulG
MQSVKNGGFGLIELMVSISIMILVTTVILTRHTSFNGAVLLRSQAYEVALALRDIQLSAVSATSVDGQYRSQLGIYFNSSASLNKTYRIFNDANQNGYQSGEEFGLQGFVDSRFEIREIRTQTGLNITANGLSIVFLRPNFDAKFFSAGTEISTPSINIDIARVGALGNINSDIKRIEISSTGQIAVCREINTLGYGCGI